MNIGQQVNYEIQREAAKFCEDKCPYKISNSSYEEGYELPCTIGKCYVIEFKRHLVR